MSKLLVLNELWQFMRENKKFWLAPIVITLVRDDDGLAVVAELLTVLNSDNAVN